MSFLSTSAARIVLAMILIQNCAFPDLWAQSRREAGLVQVRFETQSSGVVVDGSYIPDIKVLGKGQFEGAVVDSAGYVVVYLTSPLAGYWRHTGIPPHRVVIESKNGKRSQGRLVGFDERLELAVIHSPDLRGKDLGYGQLTRNDRLQFYNGTQTVSPALMEIVQKTGSPEWEIRVPRWTLPGGEKQWTGSLVLDESGQLVGVVTRAGSTTLSKKIEVYKVLPGDFVRRSVGRILKSPGYIRAGWLGISFGGVDDPLRIDDVMASSPAERVGFRSGDQVLSVEGVPIEHLDDAAWLIRWKGPGSDLDFQIRREGEVIGLKARLGEYPKSKLVRFLDIPEDGKQVQVYAAPAPAILNFGIDVHQITPQLARFFGCPKEHGLLVESVFEGSLAEQMGFKAGDVLVAVNGIELCKLSDIQNLLGLANNGRLVFEIVRERVLQKRTVMIE